MWQNANLEANGIASGRLSTEASKDNPVIALDKATHQQVNAAQRSNGAGSNGSNDAASCLLPAAFRRRTRRSRAACPHGSAVVRTGWLTRTWREVSSGFPADTRPSLIAFIFGVRRPPRAERSID